MYFFCEDFLVQEGHVARSSAAKKNTQRINTKLPAHINNILALPLTESWKSDKPFTRDDFIKLAVENALSRGCLGFACMSMALCQTRVPLAFYVINSETRVNAVNSRLYKRESTL